MTMHQLATVNNNAIISLSATNIRPSTRVNLVSKQVGGTGYSSITGTNITDADISVILDIVDAATISLQPVETNTAGTVDNISFTGLTDRQYLVSLEQDTIDPQFSSAKTAESSIRSIQQSSQSNLIQITQDVSTLIHTPIYTFIGVELKANTSDFGDEINFDGGVSIDGSAPETSRRISFSNHESTVYSQFRTFSNGVLTYRLEPELLLDIPDGTVVNEVTGGRLITITDGTDTENYPLVTSDKNFIERIIQFSELVRPLSSNLLNSDFNLGGTATLSEVVLTGDAQDTTLSNALANPTAATATYKAIVSGVDIAGNEQWQVTSSLGVDTTVNTGGTYTDGNITFTIAASTIAAAVPTTDNSLGFRTAYIARGEGELIPSVGVNPIRPGKKASNKSVTFVYTEKPAVEFDYRTVIAAGRINPACLGDETGLVAGIVQYQAALINFYTQRKALAILLTDPAEFISQTLLEVIVTPAIPGTPGTPAVPAQTITQRGYPLTWSFTGGPVSLSATYLFIPNIAQAAGFENSLINVDISATGFPGIEFGVEATVSGGGLAAPVLGRIWFVSNVNGGSLPLTSAGGTVTSFSLSDLTQPTTTAPAAFQPNSNVISGGTFLDVIRISVAEIPAIPGTPGTPAVTETVITTTNTWAAQSADIALAEALYDMMLGFLGRIAQDAVAIADWTVLFNTNATDVSNHLGPAGENTLSNTSYVETLEADFNLMLIDNGILPEGFEASGCWQDYPGERFHWVDKDAVYLPAHTNRLYVSAVLNEDGLAVSTQEFAFGIVVDGQTHLKPGDEVTIHIGDAVAGGSYEVGSSFLVNVIGQNPTLLSGGVDFNPIQIWSVSDGSLFRKFARDTSLAINPVFNDLDISFELSQIDYNLGDFFKITFNTLGFTFQIDAGPTQGPLLLQDQALTADINVAFTQGNYQVGDQWNYLLPASYGSSQALTPTEFCHQSNTGQPISLAVNAGTYDLVAVAGTDGTTVEFTNLTGTQIVPVVNGIALARYTTPQTGVIGIVINGTPSVRVKWVWAGETTKLLGHASTSESRTRIDRFGRIITGYNIKWDNTLFEDDLKALTLASAEHRRLKDLPFLLLPACERDDLAVMVDVPTAIAFEHLTRFASVTPLGTSQIEFIGVEF